VSKLNTTPWRRIGEWNYSSTHSLTSALDGGEWSASRPGRFTSRERAPGTHWIGGWVGPRSVLDAVVKRRIPSPRRESNPRTPIVQSVTQSLYRLSYQGCHNLTIPNPKPKAQCFSVPGVDLSVLRASPSLHQEAKGRNRFNQVISQ
jgi:hypothetical protein